MDFAQFIASLDAAVWGPPMIVLLLGTHLFLTVRTRFIQRKLPAALKMSVTKDEEAEGDISQYGALATALAGTIGTGNVVGVATALLAGGPGALFWMWITGVLGMATKYVETYVAVRYRVKDSAGDMIGGAMYAWRRGFKRADGATPWWAKFGAGAFALFAAVAALGVGSAVQANAMAGVIESNIEGTSTWAVAFIIVAFVIVPLLGGVTWISKFCEKLVPVMALAYVGGCLAILAVNWNYVIPAISLIVECAFTPKAAFGGAVGSGVMMALQFGCARGLFSNGSGLGSSPIVAAAAATRNPARQALVSMTGTFWDTVVVCALTGVVLVSTMIANPDISAAILEHPTAFEGAALTSLAFASVPGIGTPILVVGMVLFAYSTILGWSYYGNRCVVYLFGYKAVNLYRVLYVVMAFLGAVGVGDVVWKMADICNAFMALPNLVMVLLLSGLVARETKHYVYDGYLDEHFCEKVPDARDV